MNAAWFFTVVSDTESRPFSFEIAFDSGARRTVARPYPRIVRDHVARHDHYEGTIRFLPQLCAP